MRAKSIRHLVMIAVAVLLLGAFLVESTAQRRRRRQRVRRPTTPRITNPPIYQPPAEETNANTSTSDPATSPETNEDPQTKTIRDLTSQVDKLTNKISQMEESQRTLVDLCSARDSRSRSTRVRDVE